MILLEMINQDGVSTICLSRRCYLLFMTVSLFQLPTQHACQINHQPIEDRLCRKTLFVLSFISFGSFGAQFYFGHNWLIDLPPSSQACKKKFKKIRKSREMCCLSCFLLTADVLPLCLLSSAHFFSLFFPKQKKKRMKCLW